MRILLKYNYEACSYYKKAILIAYQDRFLTKLQFLSNNCKQYLELPQQPHRCINYLNSMILTFKAK